MEPPMSFAGFRCNVRRIKRTLLGRLRQEDRKFHDSLDHMSIGTLHQSCHVAQDSLKLMAVFLSQPSMCWDYRRDHHAWLEMNPICTHTL